jgi:hypothetical protein
MVGLDHQMRDRSWGKKANRQAQGRDNPAGVKESKTAGLLKAMILSLWDADPH